MKRLIYLLVLFFGIAFNSNSQIKGNLGDSDLQAAVQSFMHAQLNNEQALLRKMLDKDALIFIPGKLSESRITKAEYLRFAQQSGKTDQNCSPDYAIITFNSNSAKAVIKFSYPEFIVNHALKMVKRRDEWKIIELRKTIESNAAVVTVMEQY